jgi:hypothetical protein
MPRGKTLWEMLVEKVQGPVELRQFNPLKLRVGHSLTIDDPELKELNFFVREIRSYRRALGGREFPFVDYVVRARPLNGEDVVFRVRLVPMDEPDPSGPAHHVVLLRLFDEFAYDKSFEQVLTDTTKKFQVLDDDRVTEEFYRINDTVEPYSAEVTIVKDADNDGTVTSDEVEKRRLAYWDYWREDKNEAGSPVRRFLFIERDGETGWFQLWRGDEIDARQVYAF